MTTRNSLASNSEVGMDEFVESRAGVFSIPEEEQKEEVFNEKIWEWSYLRKKCRNLELEQFYNIYMQRLRMTYLSMFMVIHGAMISTHIMLLLIIANLPHVKFDITVYIASAALAWLILSVNYRQKLINRNPWIMYVSSCLAMSILILADISVPTYQAYYNQEILRPSYYVFFIFAIYLFMPMQSYVHVCLLGIAAGVSYVFCFAFVTYNRVDYGSYKDDKQTIIAEVTFIVVLNLLGLYSRLMKEIAIRTTFLDRRQCIEENLLLRYARDQEKNLLVSILPARIANKIEEDVKQRIEQMKSISRRAINDTRRLFIEPHDDVSILYADVVNYTYLTTTLDVKTLVETLHDLFVRFDNAAEEHEVLRIKFLGDCYYCVAGVPVAYEYHAKSCVNLGLRMINDIRDVREKRKLNIDMRIGVHSGSIFSGVIGACKWQYDIWSRDVDIANRLESTGMAGRVHVSESTLKMLDGEYLYEEGTEKARDDEVLKKYKIRTYLIKAPTAKINWSEDRSNKKEQIKKRQSTNFVSSSIVQYSTIRTQAKLEMSRELDKMPTSRVQLSKIFFDRSKRMTQDEMEGQSFRSNISSMSIFFKNWRWEVQYLHEPDILLKYSILFAVVTFTGIIIIQSKHDSESTDAIVTVSVFLVILLLFVIVAWYKKIWIMYFSGADSQEPKNKVSKFLYIVSDRVQGRKSIIIRTSMYMIVVAIHCIATFLQLAGCNPLEKENEAYHIQIFDKSVISMCFKSWHMTECLMLIMCLVFIFTRVPFLLKLFVGVMLCVGYAVILFFEYGFIYEQGTSTNATLYSEYSHMFILISTLCIHHYLDRQNEFISKVDFNWKRQLQRKQQDAKITNETIKILIHNILPSHVADIYMRKLRTNELYYEEYDNVAVMFATIRNYDTEQVGLRVLNEIICDFDRALNAYRGRLKVEKIKVAGWTYMAACGLDIKQSDSLLAKSIFPGAATTTVTSRRTTAHRTRAFHTVEEDMEWIGSMQHKTPRRESTGANDGILGQPSADSIGSHKRSDVVYVMAQFALDLMRILRVFNTENLQSEDGKDRGMLRIGISNGKIMAGVVGSYKPHYDIWGDAVNMASRMDSTGEPGRIQVTEHTAQTLEAFNIKCEYRGMTFVRGRGEIPTYYIAIDKNLNFVKKMVVSQADDDEDYDEDYNDNDDDDSSLKTYNATEEADDNK